MKAFAYTLPRVPARQSVVAPCWDVVSAEEKANLPVDRMENSLLFLNDEPDLRAFWLVPVKAGLVE
ncbi:uncharacterized protein METZ01_LOCUS374433 [marine metagenome]|uniref:Uncharacterized protein n=1 Tax=marine metagenome TaxID=408172 RepID=A0A382THI6_9ZZZZ